MAQYQKKLAELQKSIARVQAHLKGHRRQRGHILTELQRLESKISKNTKKIKALNEQIIRLEQRLQGLDKEMKKLNLSLRQQQQRLAVQLRASYTMGSHQQLKMLLNQQDPGTVARMQHYFAALNRARTARMNRFFDSLREKQALTARLQQTRSELEQTLAEQKQRRKTRQHQRLQRKQLIARLNEQIRNQENTLSDLQSSRDRIENLLKSLGELLADIPASPADRRPFKTLKGHLPWPVHGPMLARFGEAKPRGGLRWKGVWIGADYGVPVRAVSHGRIAFADWLQGFGFIIIIDHGDGFMSLYGHNEALTRQVGEWVQAGEVIASVGDSGGQPRSGLYFEIRQRGKPVNPAQWCRDDATFAKEE